MTCLICRRDIPADILPLCCTRHEDGALVCPGCSAKLKARDRDALDRWFDARVVRT